MKNIRQSRYKRDWKMRKIKVTIFSKETWILKNNKSNNSSSSSSHYK